MPGCIAADRDRLISTHDSLHILPAWGEHRNQVGAGAPAIGVAPHDLRLLRLHPWLKLLWNRCLWAFRVDSAILCGRDSGILSSEFSCSIQADPNRPANAALGGQWNGVGGEHRLGGQFQGQ